MSPTTTLRMSYPYFLSYILPSILSAAAISFFTTIDGFFVSRYVGPDPLAAINIVIPYCCLVYAISLMLASGAGAYVSIRMGEGKPEEARQLFSYTVAALCAIGAIVTALCLLFLKPIMIFLGSTEMLLPYTMVYG
ncbi:MAG: MATE family efflux transporter, partial [Firmicutes bacterium]|nr:MATE family efflux transporter [Bacillota bacterium]